MEPDMGDSAEQPVGECIPGGPWQFQGYDENGLCRSLNGRLAGSHKVLCSAGVIACKGRHDFYLRSDGGCVIPVYSKIGHTMRMHFGGLVNCNIVNNFSAAGKRVWQSSALVSPTKTLNTDLAPIGDDAEPTEAPHEDVELGNDEDDIGSRGS